MKISELITLLQVERARFNYDIDVVIGDAYAQELRTINDKDTLWDVMLKNEDTILVLRSCEPQDQKEIELL